MDTLFHHFQIGAFQCTSVSDGGNDYQLAQIFSNVPIEQVKQVLVERNLPSDYFYTPYSCLYVNTGLRRILIDMGGGHLMPKAGKLKSNLMASGVEPASIDTIIITHAHPDHIGGSVEPDGNLAFPEAHYILWQKEWDFWRSEVADQRAPAAHVSLAREVLSQLKGRVSLIEPGDEIFPGVSGVDASGHTPGHMAISLVSEGASLLNISDTALSPLHLKYPDWRPVFDLHPQQARQSKRKIFDRAADEKTLVLAYHFSPFPGMGYINKKDDGWEWQPVNGPAGSAARPAA